MDQDGQNGQGGGQAEAEPEIFDFGAGDDAVNGEQDGPVDPDMDIFNNEPEAAI